MKKYSIEILGQPMAKQRPRASVRGGYARVYTPKETLSYENLVRVMWQEKYGNCRITTPIFVNIVAYFGLNKSDYTKKGKFTKEALRKLNGNLKPTKKPDCDNIAKIICDGLNSVAYGDDAQIVSLTIKKYYSTQPSVYIEILEDEITNEEVENLKDLGLWIVNKNI